MRLATDVGTRAHLLQLAATGLVLAASAVGFVSAFTMDMPSHDMQMPGAAAGTQPESPLSGMPLAHMPEMWFAAAGVLVAVATGAMRGREAMRRVSAPPGRRRRAVIAVVGTTALTIDVSKTSTLGFVIPGMRAEYGLEAGTASFLAVAGLTGTAIGALLFGVLVDRLGCRSAYLIGTLGFTATSMCGSMPTFGGNVVMCALMGMAVGGLAPLLITLLTDAMGRGRSRGPVVVSLSVVATAVGYLVAAGSALWLEPIFGWRVLWLIGAPTGLLLVLLTPLLPDRVAAFEPAAERSRPVQADVLGTGLQRGYALLIGVLTFGLTTWVPSLARAGGLAIGTANLMLVIAAVVMVPCAVLMMFLYHRFGPAGVAKGLAVVTSVLLLTLTASGAVSSIAWVAASALVAALFMVNTMAAIFLPIAADLADPARRGRTTGDISLWNRLGGLCGPLVLAALVSSVSDVLVAVSVLALLCAGMAVRISRRHRAASRNAVDSVDRAVSTVR
jgi:MFS family permease